MTGLTVELLHRYYRGPLCTNAHEKKPVKRGGQQATPANGSAPDGGASRQGFDCVVRV
ncbi:hypothetical protein pYptb0022 (plasmid) [Yersinia pseudotuberculosis IP 32953]|uniref:Uncharacterized protein n=1 Tax=Yersinia pseudotuberculosis serotype I (strain IP32953) TaxID=273123 RepID=Q663D2_YERPS|nr:hypothetical protein pYptb0022 [Yersinia pseudotuberculosis IP 32953]